jgi:two-component system, chemotaxis family, protein-glutamate methylesterase/glutaminase
VEATAKARLRLSEPDDVWATAVRSRIKRLASLQLNRPTRDGRRSVAPRRADAAGREARIVAIGASTGGPPALTSVLSRLPADFRIPVVVVQHITPGFAGGLVSLLDRRVPLPVRFAVEGARIGPGIWFAADDAHLGIDHAMRFSLDRTTRRGAHRPSLDMLFESVAAAAGDGAVGVVLTGMGRDGALGVAAIRAAGGLTIAQDEASSAVFGMPRAAIDAGADLVLPLDEVGPALSSLRAVRAAS